MIKDIFQAVFTAINGVTGDIGLTIIAITFIIKLFMMPLQVKQNKSMKQQQAFNEKSEVLKKKYKGNDEKLNQELSKLMQKEGTGMAGCIVPFLQIPIMMAVYQVIRSGFEAGSSSTVLLPWISNLLARDPYFIIPVVSVLVQLLPQIFPYISFLKNLELKKSTPQMVIIMLATTAFISFTIPSGIGLYYMISGFFGVVQQFVFHSIDAYRLKNKAVVTG